MMSQIVEYKTRLINVMISTHLTRRGKPCREQDLLENAY